MEFVFDAATGEFYFLEVNTPASGRARSHRIDLRRRSCGMDAAAGGRGTAGFVRAHDRSAGALDPGAHLCGGPVAGIPSLHRTPNQSGMARGGALRPLDPDRHGSHAALRSSPRQDHGACRNAGGRASGDAGGVEVRGNQRGGDQSRLSGSDCGQRGFHLRGNHYGNAEDAGLSGAGDRSDGCGHLSTVQAWPGRIGYWNVGVPPSGPMDARSFRLETGSSEIPTRPPVWK